MDSLVRLLGGHIYTSSSGARLKAPIVRVLQAVARHLDWSDAARQDEGCWPGQQRIAAACAISDRTVRRVMREAARLNVIRYLEAGAGETNRTFFNPGLLEAARRFDSLPWAEQHRFHVNLSGLPPWGKPLLVKPALRDPEMTVDKSDNRTAVRTARANSPATKFIADRFATNVIADKMAGESFIDTPPLNGSAPTGRLSFSRDASSRAAGAPAPEGGVTPAQAGGGVCFSSCVSSSSLGAMPREAVGMKNARRLAPDAPQAVLEGRRLASWIRSINRGADHLTQLVSLRIHIDHGASGGQLHLRENKVAISKNTSGGLTLVDFEKAIKEVVGRSMKQARLRETDEDNKYVGESLYAGPLDGSAIILLDDLKAEIPVIENCPCAVLETSRGNYQHLYACDRGLTHAERHALQKALSTKYAGDVGATGGQQLHRWPGSVNLKYGKYRFKTRLVKLSSLGTPISTKGWLLESQVVSTARVSAGAIGSMGRREERGLDHTPSGLDCRRAMSLLAKGHGPAEVHAELVESAAARGKFDPEGYASRTMTAARNFLASSRANHVQRTQR